MTEPLSELKRFMLAAMRLFAAPVSACAACLIIGTAPGASLAVGSGSSNQSDFAGSAVCAGCHHAEAKAWTGSQHAQAMQEATEKTVLGDFNNAQAQHFSSKARFYRKDGRFFVETEGKDGKQAGFAVKYTFGIDPLQQYLVEFPDGRLQALPYAWDARPKSEGGQRWFHLYPTEDIPPSDPLYWTGPQQNWNYMCAECHSTSVRKNHDAAADSFQTTFSEVSVGCEACHGPGIGHVHWVQSGRQANVAHSGFQLIPAKGGQMEACDRCHSRRGEFSENWLPGQPLADTHLPVFLTPGLFEDDGQMKDEVFNTSSFQQSKMFAKGVACTDCHDPHSGELKAARSEVCSQCHVPEKFAAESHSGHSAGPHTPDCIACHMPARIYMVNDKRHDHSFRIPRPDLTVKFGVPNTCSSCHAGRDAAWAAAAVERWHGPVRKGFQTYAEAFYAARLDQPEARELLLKVAQDASAPAIARATALLQLRERPSAAADAQIQQGLRDPDTLVRIGALRALEPLPLEIRWERARANLSDPVRAVRIEAALLLADMPEEMGGPEKIALKQGWADYIAAKQFNADRAEERTNLAGFYRRQGKAELAEQEYLAAIKLAPTQVPPRVNLADLYRSLGREAEAENLLREMIALEPQAAAAHHALGLTLIRQKRYEEAAGSLKRANELEPSQPRYAYVYAVALQSAQKSEEARLVLTQAFAANPSNVDILGLLLKDALAARDLRSAASYGERLRRLRPEDSDFGKFVDQLKAAAP
jgi:predicted CXXCH cytochrome family protein